MAKPSPWLAPVMMAERPRRAMTSPSLQSGGAFAGGEILDARIAAEHVGEKMVGIDDTRFSHACVDIRWPQTAEIRPFRGDDSQVRSVERIEGSRRQLQ